MTREGALLVIIAVAVALVALLAWAWRRRQRRDATPLVAAGELPKGATVLAMFDGLYVATTQHDEPLERIAAPGWGFRSRGASSRWWAPSRTLPTRPTCWP